jgi:hypothetical protein
MVVVLLLVVVVVVLAVAVAVAVAVVVVVVVVVVATGVNKCRIKFVPLLAMRADGGIAPLILHLNTRYSDWLESHHVRCSPGERISVTLLMGNIVESTTHLKASERM